MSALSTRSSEASTTGARTASAKVNCRHVVADRRDAGVQMSDAQFVVAEGHGHKQPTLRVQRALAASIGSTGMKIAAAILGNDAKLGSLLDPPVSRQAVAQWRGRGYAPIERVLQISKLTREIVRPMDLCEPTVRTIIQAELEASRT